MEICVDFDGTCVTHDYPRIGLEIGATSVLRELVEAGNKLILFTMRSGDELQAAVDWFKNSGLPLYGIQANPTQSKWTTSPKAYGQIYIDDAALGCPLRMDKTKSDRPFVDWTAVRAWVHLAGALDKEYVTHNKQPFFTYIVCHYESDSSSDHTVPR